MQVHLSLPRSFVSFMWKDYWSEGEYVFFLGKSPSESCRAFLVFNSALHTATNSESIIYGAFVNIR